MIIKYVQKNIIINNYHHNKHNRINSKHGRKNWQWI
jgi:hypothetical protein